MLQRTLAVFAAICAIAFGQHQIEKRFSLNPLAYATDIASNAIDSAGFSAVNPIKIASKMTGAAMGTMGLVWGKQENKKCYYYWGLGFSGPESWNPSRWNGEKWDKEEEGGLLNSISDAIGVGFTAFFQSWETEEARAQTCKMLGMGYTTQQPGFPSKPGTCPEGPGCYGTPGRAVTQPRPGERIPGMPDSYVIYTIPGKEGEVQPGTPGSVVTIMTPGKPPIFIPGAEPTTVTYVTPGTPGTYTPGTPGTSTTYITPGQPGTYQPGNPPTSTVYVTPGQPGTYQPGSPPTSTVYVTPGQPGTYQPGTPPTSTTYVTPGQPGTYQPGTPGTTQTIYRPGTPGTYQPGSPPTQTTIYQQQPPPQQPQQMCSCPCQG